MYKRTWVFNILNNGFEMKLLVYGTEEEAQEYMRSEFGYIPGYSGATEKELEAAKVLRSKTYLAPEIKH